MDQNAIEQLLADVRALLVGIDQDEAESDQGWWETATGVEFGAGRLAALEALLRERLR